MRAVRLLARVGVVLLVVMCATYVAWAQPAPTPAPAGAPLNLEGRPIEQVQFRGNRKVENDAIRVQLLSKEGTLLSASKLREDVRAMWKMGFFADVDVEAEVSNSGGVILTFAVKEKPSIRKILIAGNSEVGLDKINEVLDLELDAIVDIGKVKKNRDKIAEVYVQKGFYLATVDYEIKPVNESEVDVWFKVDEKAKVKIREVQFIGNNQVSDDDLRSAIVTKREDSLGFLNMNRNKRSVVLDLKTEAGKEVLLRLAKDADILVENYRPGAMKRLGLGYEALRDVNPRLVYTSISGFGQTGPWADRPGFDLMAQAMSGVTPALR